MQLSREDLQRAWETVSANAAAGGIDRMRTRDFEAEADRYLDRIYRKLAARQYLPQAYLVIRIKKNRWERRKIALATISDKIVQTAIKQVLEPKLEKIFADTSYAYRPGKGPRRALARVKHIITYVQKTWVAKCDIDNFFDTLDHALLFEKLSPFVPDAYYRELIRMFMRMGYVHADSGWIERSRGVPQGAVLSPLLANLYLNDLDHFAAEQDMGYVRYADDFVIMAAHQQGALHDMKKVMAYIRHHLRLELNPETYVRKAEMGFRFLGIWITRDGLSIGPEKLNKLKTRINNAFRHPDFPAEYHDTVQGINNYYGALIPHHYLFPLDEFIDDLWIDRLSAQPGLQSKRSIHKHLQHLRYVTDYNNQKRGYHRRRLRDIIYERRHAPRIRDAEAAIKMRRREYEKKYTGLSHIHIGGYGKHIGKTKKFVRIRERGKPVRKIPLRNVQSIAISGTGHSLSSELIRWCALNGVSIDFVDARGQVCGKLYFHGAAQYLLWQKQAELLNDERAFGAARELVRAKITNQERLIRYFSKYARTREKDVAEQLPHILRELRNLRTRLKEMRHAPDYRARLIPIEARAGTLYWQWFRIMIDEETDFTTRHYQGATDAVNMMLNYGYGILYRYVWNAVLRHGLYPGFSVLHVPSKKKGTLIYDLIEPFRQPLVDRAVMTLINRKSSLTLEKGRLSKALRQKLIDAVHGNMVKFDRYYKERRRMYDIIPRQAFHFKEMILNPDHRFKAYTMYKW